MGLHPNNIKCQFERLATLFERPDVFQSPFAGLLLNLIKRQKEK
ncbi:hypothetical protein B0O44_103161 [Pedobacter nutrimenti]|uniref:Uncharacterized protein n=1 Tax=Pedobacter nutrimenti TaxID=1241337 RepID=A0A318UL27_9SPHI|nr:hypothetical protein B0O44_103161 [Pedobacter nutrimenti]